MAEIIVNVPNILGASTKAAYTDQLEAISIRETLEVGVQAGSAGGRGGIGRGKQSDIQLTRYKDRASPKLAEACSAALNLGEVTMVLFRVVESGSVPYMRYTLSNTYISRIEHDTLDEESIAFHQHLYPSTRGLPVPGGIGMASLLSPVVASLASTTRNFPQPVVGPRSAPSNREVERIWLNPSVVKWEYTAYSGGVQSDTIAKGFDISRNVEA